MKKVLFICDGNNFSEPVFEFICQWHEKAPFLLTGVFLWSVDYSKPAYANSTGSVSVFHELMADTEVEIAEKNMKRFEQLCLKNNIEFRVHNDLQKLPLSEIVYESRFADVMVVSSAHFYKNILGVQPNFYLKQTLRNAECPVLLIPDKALFPRHIILSYNGEKESVFAIKQFAYVFPEFCDLKTTLIYSNNKKQEVPAISYIEELSARHFSDLTISKLEFHPDSFDAWLKDQRNVLLVAGSFSRGGVSAFFKKSFSGEVLKMNSVPFFIAHHV